MKFNNLNCCLFFVSTLFVVIIGSCSAFVPSSSTSPPRSAVRSLSLLPNNNEKNENDNNFMSLDNQRRVALLSTCSGAATVLLTSSLCFPPFLANAEENIFAPKFVQEYDDFTKSSDGTWSYRDVKVGQGNSPNLGDRAVFDWSGYTIGYFGRPFQAKGGPQGGAFDKDIDYARAILGSGQIVKGLELAMMDMKPGGIRQVLIPYGELSYPPDDSDHSRVGPTPTTFSGQRALNFVLDNPRVDRTLLFNVKLVRIDKPNGKGGFVRG